MLDNLKRKKKLEVNFVVDVKKCFGLIWVSGRKEERGNIKIGGYDSIKTKQ